MKKKWTFVPSAMFPLGKKEVAGGNVTFCTTLKVFLVFFCVPEGQREKWWRKIKGKSIRKKRGQANYCCLPGRGESMEWKRTENREKRTCNKWVWQEVRNEKQRRKRKEWTFTPVNVNLAFPPGGHTDATVKTAKFGWLKKD